MQAAFESFVEGLLNTSWIEWMAVLTSVAYVILASFGSIWCWPFALITSGFYIYICFFTQLYLETILQTFYFLMGIVGWINWRKTDSESISVGTWGFRKNGLNILISGMLALLLGYYFKYNTDQASPFMDATVTSFALTATWMITKKLHEGWIYLIVVDIISIFLYAGRDLYLSAVLNLIFTLIAIFGWIAWYKQFRIAQSARRA